MWLLWILIINLLKYQTFIKWSTLANSCVLTESLQYNLSPGRATNLWANSLWNIRTAHLPEKQNQIWYSLSYNVHLNFFHDGFIKEQICTRKHKNGFKKTDMSYPSYIIYSKNRDASGFSHKTGLRINNTLS